MNQDERLPYPDYRYTKYFWTINPNVAAYTREQAHYMMTVLRDAVLKVFTQGDVVAFAHPNHQFNTIYIGENQLQLCVEVGPKRGRVHLHMIQSLKHRSVINIDPLDVQEKVAEELSKATGGRIDHVYVSKKVHPSEKPLIEYMDDDNIHWKEIGMQVEDVWTYSLVSDGSGGWSVRQSREEEIGRIDAEEWVDSILDLTGY